MTTSLEEALTSATFNTQDMGCSAHPTVTLSDIVHAAPRILEMLDPESLKAVSATCACIPASVQNQLASSEDPQYNQ
ncbi:hypothetical protein WJX82_000611 [Trebouxia sp. C0006]